MLVIISITSVMYQLRISRLRFILGQYSALAAAVTARRLGHSLQSKGLTVGRYAYGADEKGCISSSMKTQVCPIVSIITGCTEPAGAKIRSDATESCLGIAHYPYVRTQAGYYDQRGMTDFKYRIINEKDDVLWQKPHHVLESRINL